MIDFINYFYDYKIVIILIGIFIIYKYGKSKHNLHLKLGHKGPKPIPYLGNFVQIIRYGPHEMDKQNHKKYGKIYPFYFGNIKLCVVADEELLKQILIKEAKCFTDRLDLGFNGKSTEKMLTVLKGKNWERVRNLVTPTFTSGKLRKMSPLISDCVDLLKERLTKYPVDQPIDFKQFFGALTMDAIARTMFGMNIDSQTNPNNLFMINANKLFNISLFNPLIFILFIFPDLGKIIRKIVPEFEIFGRSVIFFFIDNLKKAIEERQKSTEVYNDFLALMLKSHNDVDENNINQHVNLDSKSLTTQEIMAQSLIFLLAGHETTATTLTYISYFLAKNPKNQQELYDEIENTIGIDGEINYELLMNMPVLDSIINETLRICPPAIRIDRSCTQDVVLVASDGAKIMAKKGDIFTVPIYAIQMDPELWPDPDVFDPHRFDPDQKKLHSPYSFMPFGMGPRNCVGMRFALLEAKWAIVNVVQKFQIVTCAETMEVIKFKATGLSSPIKPIILKIIKRT